MCAAPIGADVIPVVSVRIKDRPFKLVTLSPFATGWSLSATRTTWLTTLKENGKITIVNCLYCYKEESSSSTRVKNDRCRVHHCIRNVSVRTNKLFINASPLPFEARDGVDTDEGLLGGTENDELVAIAFPEHGRKGGLE